MTTNLRLPGRPEELTLPALLVRNAAEHGELPALSWREGRPAGGPSPGARSAARSPYSPRDTPPSASSAANTS